MVVDQNMGCVGDETQPRAGVRCRPKTAAGTCHLGGIPAAPSETPARDLTGAGRAVREMDWRHISRKALGAWCMSLERCNMKGFSWGFCKKIISLHPRGSPRKVPQFVSFIVRYLAGEGTPHVPRRYNPTRAPDVPCTILSP